MSVQLLVLHDVPLEILLLPHAFFWPLPKESDDPGNQHLGVTAEENKDPSPFSVLLPLSVDPGPPSQGVVDEKWDEYADRPDVLLVEVELGREGNVTVDVERGEADV